MRERIEGNEGVQDFLERVVQGIKGEELRSQVRLEIVSHVESSVEELVGQGMSETEALQLAIARMGDPAEFGRSLAQVHRKKLDPVLVAVVSVLVAFGIVLQSRAGTHFSLHLLWSALGLASGTVLYFFKPRHLSHLLGASTGLGALFMLSSALTSLRYEGLPFLKVGPLTLNVLDWVLFLSVPGLAVAVTRGGRSLVTLGAMVGIPLACFLLNQSFAHGLLWVLSFLGMSLFMSEAGWLRLRLIQIGAVVALLLGFDSAQFVQQSGESLAQLSGALNDSDHAFRIWALHWGKAGWAAALALLGLGLAVALRASQVLVRVPSGFGRNLAQGYMTLFSAEFIWHVLINVGLAPEPLGGINLPLVSYGGSQMVLQMAALGLLLGICARRLSFERLERRSL